MSNPQSTFKPIEYHSVWVPRVPGFLSSRPNWDSPTPSPASEVSPPPPEPKGEGTHSPASEVVGGVPIQTAGEKA